MNIAELRLAGFKSFVDSVRAPIEPGLTGVVGPNGCGKSNLLEAVRWVMGATSAKSMRADDMDSVIFAGSAARPAREHAEVTLVLKDARGRAGAPFADDDVLEVSRRIRRGLGSTYRINGKDVRAKDVQLLFADASTGANSPALVRQGQVSELIAAKPENRRRILEEAAGIAGLHARRHEADLKLNGAETNLSRLDEVLGEIQAQADSLKKQARQAERYRGLAAALRQTEALLLHRRWMEARAARAEIESEARGAARAVAEASAAIAHASAKGERARAALGPLREEEAIASALLRRLEGARVNHERDLAAAEEALARADQDLARLRGDAARFVAALEDANAAIARLDAELDDLTQALGSAEDAVAAASAAKAADEARERAEARLQDLIAARGADMARRQTQSAELTRAEQSLARLNSRKDALDAAAAEAARAAVGADEDAAAQAEAEAAAAALDQARAALADIDARLLSVTKAYEDASAAALAADKRAGELAAEARALAALVSETDDAPHPAVLGAVRAAPGYERALAAALGDDLLASLDAGALLRWAGASPRAAELPAEAAPLSAHVTAPPELAARLALIGVVDAARGPALRKHLAPGVRLVSRAGDVWRWDGFVRRAEAPAPAAARLEQRNRLAALQPELAAAQATAKELNAAVQARLADKTEAEGAARALRGEEPRLANAALLAARRHETQRAQAQLAAERRAMLTAQAAALNADLADAIDAAKTARAAVQPQPAYDETDLQAASAAAVSARAAAVDTRARAASLTQARDSNQARQRAAMLERTEWRARAEMARQQRMEADKTMAALEAQRTAALDAPAHARRALDDLLEQQHTAEQRRAAALDALAAAERGVRDLDQALRAREAAHAAAREARAAHEAHLAAAAARLADCEAQARDQAGLAVEELAGAAGPLIAQTLATGPIGDIERKLERLRTERDQAGPVNLRAEEEMAEALARIADLSKEKDDVAQAVAKLRRAISTLNAEGRRRLLAAYETVNANFTKLFTALFEGGAAELTLTQSDDPLAAGLEIMAQPPGKKLTTLSLMSGGEQALTATALIFAVFLANPAPICVLDEVDAPLDDANVDRFCRLLDEMKKLTSTRFLVITHNPVTMSRVDRLYGVTMPELGVSQLVSVDLTRARQLAATA